MQVAVVTVFPEMFDAVERFGITGRAVERGLLRLVRIDPRDFVDDRHRTVDDRPYGGGPGMVMLAAPMGAAIRQARVELGQLDQPARVVCLSPQGQPLTQNRVRELASLEKLILVCGRYEGIDERFIDTEVDEELSLGDYVLSGGELAAMVVIDAATRRLPGALGDERSALEDSFEAGLLDCPHYSRPEVLEGRRVPAVLLSGNHAEIRRWRLKQSLGRTWLRRPDLLVGKDLNEEQRLLLEEFKSEHSDRGEPGVPGKVAGE